MMFRTLIAILISLSCTHYGFAQEKKGIDIIHDYENSIQVQDLVTEMEMKVISKSGRVQERKLTQFVKEADECENCYNSVLRFEYPNDIRNTAALTLEHGDLKEDDQWLYLPAIGRSRRISPSNQKDRFMGTEVTYEDISNALSEDIKNYNYSFVNMDEKDGQNCYVLEITPNNENTVKKSGYKKRKVWFRADNLVIIYTEFYDKTGELLKTMHTTDVKKIANTDNDYRAHYLEMDNKQTGNKTIIKYNYFEIDQGLESSLFTKRALEKEGVE